MADVRRELLEKSRKQAKRRRQIWLAIFGVVIVLIIVGIVFFLRWSEIRVATVVVSGNKTVKTEDVTKLIEGKIAGQWLWLIPKNNSLFVDKTKLGQMILVEFPDIRKVEVKREGFTKLDFKVSERAPEILWCDKSEGGDMRAVVATATTASSTATSTAPVALPISQTSENCFYADKTGFIFSDAPNFSGNVMFKVYGLLSSDPVGGRPLPLTDFTDLLKTIDALPNLFQTAGLSATVPKSLSLDENGDVKVLVSGMTAGGDWRVIFHYRQDLAEVASNLNTIFNSTEFKADKASSGTLDYIDLRFGKKVFYKFK